MKRCRDDQPELKFIDTLVVDAFMDFWQIQELKYIPNGTGQSKRIGNRVMVTELKIRGVLIKEIAVVADETGDVCRLVVILDTQANGALPDPTLIWESAQSWSFLNMDEQSRFKIICQETWDMNNMAGAGLSARIQSFCASCPPVMGTDVIAVTAPEGDPQYPTYARAVELTCPMNVEFNFEDNVTEPDPDVTEMKSNNIFLCFSSLTGETTLILNNRMRFYDIQ